MQLTPTMSAAAALELCSRRGSRYRLQWRLTGSSTTRLADLAGFWRGHALEERAADLVKLEDLEVFGGTLLELHVDAVEKAQEERLDAVRAWTSKGAWANTI